LLPTIAAGLGRGLGFGLGLGLDAGIAGVVLTLDGVVGTGRDGVCPETAAPARIRSGPSCALRARVPKPSEIRVSG